MSRITMGHKKELDAKDEKPWTVATYPFPDHNLPADDRPKAVTSERLLWPDGRLAVPVGFEYAIEDRDLMITEAEYHERHST